MTNIGPYYRDFSAGMTDWFKIGLPLMQQMVQKIDVGDKDIVVGRSGGFMKVSDQMDRGGPLSRVLCWRGVRQSPCRCCNTVLKQHAAASSSMGVRDGHGTCQGEVRRDLMSAR